MAVLGRLYAAKTTIQGHELFRGMVSMTSDPLPSFLCGTYCEFQAVLASTVPTPPLIDDLKDLATYFDEVCDRYRILIPGSSFTSMVEDFSKRSLEPVSTTPIPGA